MDMVLSVDCELHEFERIELIKNHFVNPHEAFDDTVIEPVEVKENTRLWRMLTEQQEKERQE